MTLGRKWIGPWHGQLKLKLILISNDVLNFNDAILPTRFVKINFTQSFAEREDADLREKLKAEISGIPFAAWPLIGGCLQGAASFNPRAALSLNVRCRLKAIPTQPSSAITSSSNRKEWSTAH